MITKKSFHVKHDMTLEIDMRKHPALEYNVTIAPGRQLNVVWLGNGLPHPVRPALNVVVKEKARLHLALAMARAHDAEAKAALNLAGSGAEAYVSGLFHGYGDDRHAFDVAMHHRAKNTKGDILIKGVYEDSSFGQFDGLLKIHPGADRTNSYFADNILLFDRGMATSVPTLEILANDVRATHGSTTSRVNAEQLFYLRSRGLYREQAIRHIILGFFHPVLARLPMNAEKLFPHMV